MAKAKAELTPEQKAAKDKARREAVRTVYTLAGFGSAIGGIAMLSVPVALIIGGSILIAAAIADASRTNKG